MMTKNKKTSKNRPDSRFSQIRSKATAFISKRWKLVLILLFALAGIVFWRSRATQQDQPELTFEQPQYRNLAKVLEVSGVVDADEKANLRFAMGGKLVYLGAKEGDWVNKWQTIARIDPRELQKRLEQDLNLYMKERWDWENTQDEFDYSAEDLSTRRTIDQEQWDLENQVLNVEIRDIAIRETYLSAPFAGVLVNSPADTAGVTLLATDAFELINPDTIVFKAGVDEVDVAEVQLNQPAKIYLDAYPDDPIETSVQYVAYTSSEAATGTVFLVKFPILGQNLLGKYRLGMNGDVEITTAVKDNVLSIPYIATRERDGQTYVDVKVGDNEYEAREIKTGLETEDYIEVVEGLTEADLVLIPEI